MTTVTHLTETQRFRQDWLWALLLVGTVPGFCLAAVAIVVDSSGPWTTHLPLLALAALLVLGPLPLFWWAGLRTDLVMWDRLDDESDLGDRLANDDWRITAYDVL